MDYFYFTSQLAAMFGAFITDPVGGVMFIIVMLALLGLLRQALGRG